MGTPWMIVVAFGPLLLLLFIGWSLFRERQQTRPGDEARSDEAAKRLRQQLDAEDKAREQREDNVHEI